MSSILKALKKLESEKAQRDELSTAVASDILRTSRHPRVKSFSLAIFAFIVALIGIGIISYFAGVRSNEAGYAPTTASSESAPAADGKVERVLATAPAPSLPSKLPELSGIIYQQDPASRMAIINDLPVMEGTLVEGFVVKKILPQKVVIFRDGDHYDLVLPPD